MQRITKNIKEGKFTLDEENYLITDNGGVYKFNLNTKEKELYLNWVDANVVSSSVRGYQMLEDGNLLVATQTYDYETYQNIDELAIIEEIPAEEAAKIKSVTLACIYTDERLEQRVININKKNPETRIRIKKFYQDYSDMDYEDAIAGFMYSVFPLKVRFPSGESANVPPSFITRKQFNTARASVACFLMGMGAIAHSNSLDTLPFENKSSLATKYTGPRNAEPTIN